jgi:hypothetical protein
MHPATLQWICGTTRVFNCCWVWVSYSCIYLCCTISREQSAAAIVDDEAWCSSGGSEIATVLLSTTSGVPEGMTKTQWKKQLRQQKRVLKWERSKWVEFSMGTYMHIILNLTHKFIA